VERVDAETAIELVQFAYFKEVSGKATKRKRRQVGYFSQLNRQRNRSVLDNSLSVIILFVLNLIKHSFICHPSNSTVSEDAGFEPRTLAVTVKRCDIYNDVRRFGIDS
jgi:hypothetical protein